MWVFLTKRLRVWLLLAVGLPVLARLGALAADTLERRSGTTRTTRLLRTGSRWAQRTARTDATGIAARVTHLIPGDDPAFPATAGNTRWSRR